MLVRAAIVAEGVPGGPAGLRRALGELETLGVSRRGYLVDGLGGAQHALPGAIERLREVRDPLADAPRHRARSQRSRQSLRHRPALAGAARRAVPRAQRVRSVVLRNGEPLAFLERGARTLLSLQPLEPGRLGSGRGSPRRRPRSRAARARCSSSASTARPRPARRVATAFTAAGFVAGPEAPDAAREALALPEGHTLELAALRMAPLVGHRVAAQGPGYQAPPGLAEALDGRVLESVEARGKHLLAGFDNGRILHSHLRMTGAWHVYRGGTGVGAARRAAPGWR